MTETFEWEELKFINIADWPLEDSEAARSTASELVPNDTEFVRRRDGYSLMRFKGAYGDE